MGLGLSFVLMSFVLMSFALVSASAHAQDDADQESRSLVGHWSGVIVFEPIKGEIDLLLDIREDEHGLGGKATVPIANMEGHSLDELSVHGRSVSFQFTDIDAVRRFEGEVSDDGKWIRGKHVVGEASFPFELQRGPLEEQPPPKLHPLTSDLKALRTAFDADRDSARLMLLLSPSCSACKAGARAIQRYVLDRLDEERLKVYVVWLPVAERDSAARAEAETVHVIDPRASHFWAPDMGLAKAFKKPLGLEKASAWDVYLLFEPGTPWGQDLPALSSFWHLQQTTEFPVDRQLDVIELAEEIRELLGGA
jgi:hypothetical protein